jgi:hypothetical protein
MISGAATDSDPKLYGVPQHSEMFVHVFLEYLKAQFPENLANLSVAQLLACWSAYKRKVKRLP